MKWEYIPFDTIIDMVVDASWRMIGVVDNCSCASIMIMSVTVWSYAHINQFYITQCALYNLFRYGTRSRTIQSVNSFCCVTSFLHHANLIHSIYYHVYIQYMATMPCLLPYTHNIDFCGDYINFPID